MFQRLLVNPVESRVLFLKKLLYSAVLNYAAFVYHQDPWLNI